METSIARLKEVFADIDGKVHEAISKFPDSIEGTEILDELKAVFANTGFEFKDDLRTFVDDHIDTMKEVETKLEEILCGNEIDGESDTHDMSLEKAKYFVEQFDVFNDFLIRLSALFGIPSDAQEMEAPLQTENTISFARACIEIYSCKKALEPKPAPVEQDTTNDED